jgi:hypothetical protein
MRSMNPTETGACVAAAAICSESGRTALVIPSNIVLYSL